MKVKICGITELESAIAAVENGADAIGFVFAKSSRQITAEKAKEIIEGLPEGIMKVGVFVNESKEEIEKIVSVAGLTHVQLHGDELPAFCKSLSMPMYKAISIQKGEDLKEIDSFPGAFILLDGPKGKYSGGNGVSFEWDTVKVEELAGKQIILAGGLHEGNVVDAIRKIKPYMVDVSSGVETSGRKDVKKIKSFINTAKGEI
ncbi:MAG: phosphoribosylanthranilate isomerase [Bacillota bacterium]|nr:phosphoribosylanthranilate isomerase [Bacillota bacterium]